MPQTSGSQTQFYLLTPTNFLSTRNKLQSIYVSYQSFIVHFLSTNLLVTPIANPQGFAYPRLRMASVDPKSTHIETNYHVIILNCINLLNQVCRCIQGVLQLTGLPSQGPGQGSQGQEKRILQHEQGFKDNILRPPVCVR